MSLRDDISKDIDNTARIYAILTTRQPGRTSKGDLLCYNYNCWVLCPSLLGQGFEMHSMRPDEEAIVFEIYSVYSHRSGRHSQSDDRVILHLLILRICFQISKSSVRSEKMSLKLLKIGHVCTRQNKVVPLVQRVHCLSVRWEWHLQ